MENKDISYKSIKDMMSSYLEDKNKDTNIKPDIIIETAEPSYFAVSLYTNNHTINTGVGGFKLFLQNMSGLEFSKVSYNGIILNQKEKQELYAKYR